MKTFYAVSSKLVKIGGLMECIYWAKSLIQNEKAKIVKIFMARPDEKEARAVFEVTCDGVIVIPCGRKIPIADLKRMLKDAEKKD